MTRHGARNPSKAKNVCFVNDTINIARASVLASVGANDSDRSLEKRMRRVIGQKSGTFVTLSKNHQKPIVAVQ